jgi:acetoin utilization deacetylase AcuC-like enzyme
MSSAGGRGEFPACLVYSDGYYADIGAHVFPMVKFALTRRLLLAEGWATPPDFVEPEPATDADVLRVHSADYVRKLTAGTLSPLEILTLELPWSPELTRASWLCAGGTLLASKIALATGFAANLAGGFHHAFPDHGEGFCVLHDPAIALRALLAAGEIRRAAVLDLDVHQGNGTACIFAADPSVFTCSIHQEDNYPAVKPPSDLDLGLPTGADGRAYGRALDQAIPAVLAQEPELLVYIAGADPYIEDQLGGLALTRGDLAERDRRVFEAAASRAVPVVVLPAGGYAREMADTVAIHATTVRLGLAQLRAGSPQ